jgi:eukaryotic-like serine/threonine-protein kinase
VTRAHARPLAAACRLGYLQSTEVVASSDASLRSGDTLGSYQLLVPIGAGGMGRVWVARKLDAGLGPRFVAIKTALSEDGGSEEFWRTLFDEARIASLLSHPNILTIHAVEHERGIHYLVMDFSDGVSLRELLDAVPGKKLEPRLGARIAARLCAGLHAAHELMGEDGVSMGVVHRDVSPQNVLVASNGQVRLTDFGVAKARGQLHAPTQTGEVKGKIAYMAPEQVTTKDIDRRVDVFAAGCVLYEATVGERPFQGGDALATLYQLLEEPIVPPSARAQGYPPELEAIVLKAMERDRDNRYETAAEFNRALEGWLLTEKAVVTERDVANLLKTAVGGRLADVTRAIESALTDIESGHRPRDSMSGEPVSNTSPSGGSKTLAGAALPESAHPQRPPRLAIAVGGLAIAAGVAIFLSTREETATPPGPSPTASQPAAAIAPPPEPIKPPEPKSAEPVTSAAPVPSADVATTSTRPRGRPTWPARQPTQPAAPTTPAAPTPPTPATTPTPRAGELPPVVKKVRTLDPDNPFAPKEE